MGSLHILDCLSSFPDAYCWLVSAWSQHTHNHQSGPWYLTHLIGSSNGETQVAQWVVFVCLWVFYWVYVSGFVCLLVCLSVYVLCDCVLSRLCLCEMTDTSKNMTKSTQPFISAPSTWSLKICHITTAGSANNGRHYRVVRWSAFIIVFTGMP